MNSKNTLLLCIFPQHCLSAIFFIYRMAFFPSFPRDPAKIKSNHHSIIITQIKKKPQEEFVQSSIILI